MTTTLRLAEACERAAFELDTISIQRMFCALGLTYPRPFADKLKADADRLRADSEILRTHAVELRSSAP